jgi:hypothetical protein
MDLAIEIIGATRDDALAIADIHLAARAQYVVRLHTDDETRTWFASIVGNRPSAWWLARQAGESSAICLSTANISITFMYTLRRRAAAWAQRCCTRREVSALDVLLS